MAQTVYERIGGFSAVRRIVSNLYDRLCEDDRLAQHFHGVSMPQLIDHQTKFVSYLLGGPASITDEQLERAHKRLNLGDGDFEEMIAVFREVLEDADLDRADIDHAEREMRRRKPYVVSRRA